MFVYQAKWDYFHIDTFDSGIGGDGEKVCAFFRAKQILACEKSLA